MSENKYTLTTYYNFDKRKAKVLVYHKCKVWKKNETNRYQKLIKTYRNSYLYMERFLEQEITNLLNGEIK